MTDSIETIRAAIVAGAGAGRAAVRGWRDSDGYAAVARAFADCPPDDPEAVADRAEALFAQPGWAAALLEPLVTALSAQPLLEPPLKPSRDALRIGAVLFDCPAVSIVASITHADALAAAGPPTQLVFSGRMSVLQVVRAGGAALNRWRSAPDAQSCVPLAPIAVQDGMVLRCDGRQEAQLFQAARSDIVTLTATIRAGAAPLLCAYDARTLGLVQRAYADDRPSRAEMLLALLRASGRADAGDRFDAVTRDADDHLRWSAMRQWLALDARAAHPRLAQMAVCDPSGSVRVAACITLARIEPRLAACRA